MFNFKKNTMKTFIIIITSLLVSLTKMIAQKTNYQVVFPEEPYTNYVQASKKRQQNLTSLYLEKVRLPLYLTYFSKSEYAPFTYEYLGQPILEIAYLEKTLMEIKKNKELIKKTVINALQKSNKLLQNEEITVYILPPSSQEKKLLEMMKGISGFTSGSQHVIIAIDPNIKGWNQMLSYAVAHEFNHTYWTKKNLANVKKWTLLDYLIFEGRGDCFAKLLYPDVKTPWTNALTEKERKQLWLDLQPKLKNENFSFHEEVLFGSDKFPLWGGYSLGYDIVQKYVSKNKTTTAKKWVNLSAEEIAINY